MPVEDEVVRQLPARRGHFRLESGHHGELWLELESLCLRPAAVRALARKLADRLQPHRIEVTCGPLVEGAFVALLVSEQLEVPFTYSEPQGASGAEGLFPVAYRIPDALRAHLAGRRVAVVNDVINAGSAVRGTLQALRACGGKPVAIGTLAVLGEPASRLASENAIPLETLSQIPNAIWVPAECPLCARGVPLSNGAGADG